MARRSPVTLFHDISFGDLDMTADPSAFVSTFGNSIEPVTFVFDAVCYGSGTRILTDRGEIEVQDLAVGDLVVTASGERRPIRWLGSRTLDCNAHPDARAVWPIRIAAHAFADNQPSRDLFVSPAHALRVSIDDDVLVPACRLINGSTIARCPAETVTYWHVELDSHDLLLADGLPAESYLECGNRRFFTRNEASALPEPRDRPANGLCLPLIEDGAILTSAREALEARARSLGWSLCDAAEAALVVDGETTTGLRLGSTLVFLAPTTASEICLRSDSFAPDDLNGHDDRRRLGLNIHALSLQGESGEARHIALDDPRLGEGFHHVERDGDHAWRWTDGAASLPAALWRGLEGVVTIRIVCDGGKARRWKAPLVASAPKAERPPLRLVG